MSFHKALVSSNYGSLINGFLALKKFKFFTWCERNLLSKGNGDRSHNEYIHALLESHLQINSLIHLSFRSSLVLFFTYTVLCLAF